MTRSDLSPSQGKDFSNSVNFDNLITTVEELKNKSETEILELVNEALTQASPDLPRLVIGRICNGSEAIKNAFRQNYESWPINTKLTLLQEVINFTSQIALESVEGIEGLITKEFILNLENTLQITNYNEDDWKLIEANNLRYLLSLDKETNSATINIADLVTSLFYRRIKNGLITGQEMDLSTLYNLGLIDEEGRTIIEQTINEKIEINVEEKEEEDKYYGSYPLHLTVEQSNTRAAAWLLRNGAEINARNNQGFTAFSNSVHQEDYVMAKFLSAQGANVNLKDHEGTPPLYCLTNYEKTETSTSEEGQEEQKGTEQTIPIWQRILNVFIDNSKTNFRITGFNDNTILHVVKHPDIATALLEIRDENGNRKLDINQWNIRGDTALEMAVITASTEVARILIINGANLCTTKHDRVSPPIFAAMNLETISLLDEIISGNKEEKNAKKARFIKAARAIQALRLTYSPLGLASPTDFLQETITSGVSRNLHQTGPNDKAAAALVDANNIIIQGNNFTNETTGRKFQIMEAPYRDHTAYFVCEYNADGKLELLHYLDGGGDFQNSHPSSRAQFGVASFRISAEKLSKINPDLLTDFALFQEHLESAFISNDLRSSGDINRLFNRCLLESGVCEKARVPEIVGRLIEITIQRKGNCNIKSFHLLLRFIAIMRNPEIPLSQINEAYKSYKENMIMESFTDLIAIYEEEKNLMKSDPDNKPLFFDTLLETMKLCYMYNEIKDIRYEEAGLEYQSPYKEKIDQIGEILEIEGKRPTKEDYDLANESLEEVELRIAANQDEAGSRSSDSDNELDSASYEDSASSEIDETEWKDYLQTTAPKRSLSSDNPSPSPKKARSSDKNFNQLAENDLLTPFPLSTENYSSTSSDQDYDERIKRPRTSGPSSNPCQPVANISGTTWQNPFFCL